MRITETWKELALQLVECRQKFPALKWLRRGKGKLKERRFFRISSESQYRVSNQCELARVRNLFLNLALKLGNPETKTQGDAGFVIPMNKS